MKLIFAVEDNPQNLKEKEILWKTLVKETNAKWIMGLFQKMPATLVVEIRHKKITSNIHTSHLLYLV